MRNHRHQFNAAYLALATQRDALRGYVLAVLRPICEAIDPNWHRCFIELHPHARLVGETAGVGASSADACLPPPARVWVNGPADGDQADCGLTAETLSPDTLSLVVAIAVQLAGRTGTLVVENPDHELAIVPGATRFVFENCTTGLVLTEEGHDFVVSDHRGYPLLPDSLVRYTWQQVMDELARDPYQEQWGGVVDVDYLPIRFSRNAGRTGSFEAQPRLDLADPALHELLEQLPPGADRHRFG